MTHSLYYKFILGYLVFGLLGFASIATLSSRMTERYLIREQADLLYDEANQVASTYSGMYHGKDMDLISSPAGRNRPLPSLPDLDHRPSGKDRGRQRPVREDRTGH